MALNKNRLDKARSESSTGGGGSFMKMKNGKSNIRIFSFKHKVTAMDVEMGRYNLKRDGVKVGEESEELERMVSVHFRNNAGVNCAGAGCSYCAEADEYAGSDDAQDKKTYRALKARKAFFVNCVNMDAQDAGMQILGLPPSAFNEILSFVVDPEFGEEILGPTGRDFIITKDTTQDPANMYDVKLRDQKRSDELDEKLLDQTHDLFQHPALEPGWSTNSSLKSGDAVSARDDKPAKPSKVGKPVRGEDEEEEKPTSRKNPFQDKPEAGKGKAATDSDEKFPWEEEENDDKSAKGGKPERRSKKPELPDFVEKGGKVSFKGDDDEILTGVVTKILVDEGKIDVETDDDIWTIKYEEAIKPAKEKTRRSK